MLLNYQAGAAPLRAVAAAENSPHECNVALKVQEDPTIRLVLMLLHYQAGAAATTPLRAVSAAERSQECRNLLSA